MSGASSTVSDPTAARQEGRLRILHVLHGLHAGGMENGVINLSNGHAGRGIIHHICSLTDAGQFADRLPETSLVSQLHKPEGFSLKTCLKLRGLIRSMRPDVVHSHNYSGLIYSSAALLGTGIPLLAGEHAQLTRGEMASHRLCLRKWLYRRFCRVVHTVSSGQREELLNLGLAPSDAIMALPNGVDTLRFHPRSKESGKIALNLPADCVLIGMVSRLARHKRHDLLLEAFAQLGGRHPSLHLAIVGDRGNAKEEVLNAIASHRYQDRIHWLGMRDDLPDVYPAFDLLVLPSESEGMSNVCLEAMACGVPAVVNDACGATEIIVDEVTGLIRPMPDAASLANWLECCISRPNQLREWGRNASDHIQGNFSIASMMDRYECVYRDLANR